MNAIDDTDRAATDAAGPARTAQPLGAHLFGTATGSTVAVVFGFLYVALNTGGLSTGLRTALVTAAALVAIAVLVVAVRLFRRAGALRSSTTDGTPVGPTAPASTGRRRARSVPARFGIITIVEVAAILAGTRVLGGVLGRPDLGVAWVTIVVGVHFLPLGSLFRLRRFHVLAAILTVLGGLALVLGLTLDTAPTAVLAGVLPGFVLLGFAAWAVASVGIGSDRRAHG